MPLAVVLFLPEKHIVDAYVEEGGVELLKTDVVLVHGMLLREHQTYECRRRADNLIMHSAADLIPETCLGAVSRVDV